MLRKALQCYFVASAVAPPIFSLRRFFATFSRGLASTCVWVSFDAARLATTTYAPRPGCDHAFEIERRLWCFSLSQCETGEQRKDAITPKIRRLMASVLG